MTLTEKKYPREIIHLHFIFVGALSSLLHKQHTQLGPTIFLCDFFNQMIYTLFLFSNFYHCIHFMFCMIHSALGQMQVHRKVKHTLIEGRCHLSLVQSGYFSHVV